MKIQFIGFYQLSIHFCEIIQEDIYIYFMKSQIAGGLALFTLIAVSILVSFSEPMSIQDEFEKWQEEFGLHFDTTQVLYRLKIFQNNVDQIKQHNSQAQGYELGLNQFAHLTASEFKEMYTNDRVYTKAVEIQTFETKKVISEGVSQIDWEKQGKVSAVGSQGQCDAGYSFCTTSLLESYRLIKNNTNQLLSTQQIIDCSGTYQTFGCKGGTRTGAIKYAQEKGLKLSSEYPFAGVQGTCKFETGTYKLPQTIQADGCDALAKQLQSSPLTIAANTENWQFYRSGILNTCATQVNHDVFLVGVSETYWKIKNSWGNRWGQFGYIRIASGETCGICSKPGFGFK